VCACTTAPTAPAPAPRYRSFHAATAKLTGSQLACLQFKVTVSGEGTPFDKGEFWVKKNRDWTDTFNLFRCGFYVSGFLHVA
jgi:hypothetical protein